jgi:hypothetical protein
VPYNAHPSYTLNNNTRQSLQNFYDKTMQKVAAGNCGPSKLIN